MREFALSVTFQDDKKALEALFAEFGHTIEYSIGWEEHGTRGGMHGFRTFKIGLHGHHMSFGWARAGKTALPLDDALVITVTRTSCGINVADHRASGVVGKELHSTWVEIGKHNGQWFCNLSDIPNGCEPIPRGFYKWLLHHTAQGRDLDGTKMKFPEKAVRALIKMFLTQNP